MRGWSAWLAIVLLASALGGHCNVARAQAYPNRTITLVVPFPPGGSTSIVGRLIADKMSELLGQSIVVDNRGGAGGTVGTKAVTKSDPDGYTLLVGYTGTLAIAPSLYRNAGYDPRKDFAPIGMIGHAPSSLVVHPSFPAKTVAELVAYAKANPGKINFGSAGIGTVGHITGEYFAQATGIQIVHIPYKGTGPAMSDLLGGHIPMSFSPIATTAANVKAGLLACACRDVAPSQQIIARRADHDRSRRVRFRRNAGLWPGGAGGHAACRDRPPQQGVARCACLRGRQKAARVRRHRDHARVRRSNMPTSSTRTKRSGRNSSRRAASSRSS